MKGDRSISIVFETTDFLFRNELKRICSILEFPEEKSRMRHEKIRKE